MKVSFIGLGIMGRRMASNLLQNSVDLTVYNRSREPVEMLKKEGARVAASIEEAVEKADLVLSMLSTPEVVSQVFLGAKGALSFMKKGAIWVDCTTVNPSFSVKAGEAARSRGLRFMDAPVAGTKPHAENAELTFFVGGEASLFAEAKPYLEFMGRKVLHLGKTGKGTAFKMVVNIMLAQSMIIFSEALLLGERMGISRDFLLTTLPNLAVAAPFTKFKAEKIKENDYDVQFPLEWMHKDLHLAATTAYELNHPLYVANLTKEFFAAANAKGMGRLDFAAIHKYLASSTD
jgi:3-hydroxyisobutyrate dehydrogenase-like beta-hydroxyacid dehydrogenase